jgi:peptidoglycan/LPS O-acetylase OafA/YrhL
MRSRTTGFDLIRISAAFVIFLGHLGGQHGPDLVPVSAHAGLAVMAFFALSGYLIYRPFLYHKVRVSDHYSRRLLRIVPAWALATLGIGIAIPWAISWLLLVTWSLLVELAFYATLPLIARLAAGRELRVVGGLGIASLVALWLLPAIDVPLLAMPLMLPFFFCTFAAGMILAVLDRDHPTVIHPRPLLIAGAALVVAGFGWAAVGDPTGTSTAGADGFVALGTACLMGASLRWEHSRGASRIALAADASYPFYLWHASILVALAPTIGGIALAVVGFALAATISTASVVLVEHPIRRWWERLKKATTPKMAPEVSAG